MAFVKSLRTGSGGDWPEATKTALAFAYTTLSSSSTTLILHYADAPPHTFFNNSLTSNNQYLKHEQAALSEEGAYGGLGKEFKDWVSVGRIFSKREGEGGRRAVLFSILDGKRGNIFSDCAYYNCESSLNIGGEILTVH